MATGTVFSGTIDTTGHWLDLDVETGGVIGTGGSYALGFDPVLNNIFTTAKVSMSIDTTGYTNQALVSKTRANYGTRQVRKAYDSGYTPPYPNRESIAGGTITIRLALWKRVYAGETVTLNALDGWYSQGGGSTLAVSGLSITNNSTAAFPKVMAQVDRIYGAVHCDRVTGDFNIGANAEHVMGGVEVVFDGVGLTSSHAAAQQVGVLVKQLRSASGLYYYCHAAVIPTSGMTTGERIKVRIRAYPEYGDAGSVFDSDTHDIAASPATEIQGFGSPIVAYNTTQKIAYVDPSGGNDTTGVANVDDGTALASPCKGIGKAMQKGATLIKLLPGTVDGTHDYPSSPITATEWRKVVYASTANAGNCVLVPTAGDARYLECTRLQFDGIKIQLQNDTGYFDGNGQTNFIRFSNCTFDSNGHSLSAGLGYRMYGTFLDNCTGININDLALYQHSGNVSAFSFDGCTLNSGSSVTPCDGAYRVVACSATGAVGFKEKDTSSSPVQSNFFFCNNKFASWNGSTTPALILGTTTAVSEVCICGNLWEFIASEGLCSLAADSSSVDVFNCKVANNTIVGGRWNFCYNDTGSTARLRYDWYVTNNVVDSWPIKSDTYSGGSGRDAARIGNHPMLYGTNASGNVLVSEVNVGAAGSLSWEFGGVSSYHPTIDYTAQPLGCSTNNAAFAKYVDRQAYDGSGTAAGGGTYTFQAGAVARSITIERSIFCDFTGAEFNAVDAAGCYHHAEAATGAAGWW